MLTLIFSSKSRRFGIWLTCVLAAGISASQRLALASCGGTVRTWDAGGNSVQWQTANNWNINNAPDTSSEDAVIVAASRIARMTTDVTIGCMEVQSGFLDSRAGSTTVTITGDYFRNLTQGSMTIQSGDNHTFALAGSGPQSFENYDNVKDLVLSGNNTVTFTNPFHIMGTLSITGSSTVLKINADLSLDSTTNTLVIPSGTTVELNSGAILTANAGITVNGTLKINSGSSLVLGNGKTLSVPSGGVLQLNGSSGNVATLDSTGAGSTYALTVAGQMSATYFKISRTNASGLNLTSGTIQSMDNGEFHYLSTNGYAISVGVSATLPSTMYSMGFFNDSSNSNVRNFNVNASYTGGSSFLDNWAGGVGGAPNETDPNSKINWGTQAGTNLTLQDGTASGSPPSTLGQGSSDTYFATFAFALTKADTQTDIQSVLLTMTGTASASDIDVVKIYRDAGGGTNCVYNTGTDTQVGSDLTLSGSPPVALINFNTGDVAPSSTSPKCFHVVAATSNVATGNNTIQFSIQSTNDVVNSIGYNFSSSSGPPVTVGTTTIIGATVSDWRGKNSTSWNVGQNWQGNIPNNNRDCDIGPATRICQINIASASCQTATLITNGTLDFNNTTNELGIYGTLDVQSGFLFTSASSGSLAMVGANNQSFKLRTIFPGNVRINNTGVSGSNTVSVDTDSIIQGNLNIQSGILKIVPGVTLEVRGTVTVNSGATLEITPGGTLKLANGKTLTVNSGGKLKIVGDSANTAKITSNSASAGYTVVINGTIEARYYTFDHLGFSGGLTGVAINSGATLDATNHLQDGTYTYPLLNGVTFLKLSTKIPPGNSTEDMNHSTFDSSGASVTLNTITNIDTTGVGASGTLTLNNYVGDLSGPTYSNTTTYLLSWTGATNTIDLSQNATGPTSVSAGQTYTMGRYLFKQTQAGASFTDASLTSLKLTLTGTGSASDISAVRIYYSATCQSTGGTLIGTGTLSGNPASATFNISMGSALIEASTTTPPNRCVYVQYDIAPGAIGGNTVGVEINASNHVSTDVGYMISGGTTFPVNLGSPASISASPTTTWTGTTDTDWTKSTNWSAGVPSSTKICQINSASNNPQINTGVTASCNHVIIGNGTLTLQSATSILQVYGNFTNTGTFNQNTGVLSIRDSGVASDQTVQSTGAIKLTTTNKSGGGTITLGGTTSTLSNFSLPSGTTFEFIVPSNHTATFSNGLTVTSGTFTIKQGGIAQIPSGQGITINGGTFKIQGINDSFGASGQNLTSKGKVTRSGASGRWFFSATSGAIDLTGFLLEYLDSNGLNLSGTANLIHLDGGQFVQLDPASGSKAIQLNTSSAISTTTANNVGWMWGAANNSCSAPCTPSTSSTYYLVYAPACGGTNLTFTSWFGDFTTGLGGGDQVVTENKIYDADDGGPNCQISISVANSPVSLGSFQATGYNGKISVDWVTVLESLHAGFNVYRSYNPYSGYIQVNNSLLKNFATSTLFSGTYRYIDTDVINGVTYYYYIEDVGTDGSRKMHGPVAATPDASAGTAPAVDPSINNGLANNGAGSGNSPGSSSVSNKGLLDLGNGVHLLAKTSSSLRIEIIPPTPQWNAASWNSSYEDLQVPGYSALTSSGDPALPERVLFIEVKSGYTTVTPIEVLVTESTLGTHLISPAPSWALNGSGVLQPSYNPNSASYTSSSYSPSTYYTVDSALQSIGGKSFIKITLHPIQYLANSQNVKFSSKIVLDLGLDGNAWALPTVNPNLSVSPSAVDGVLRIRYRQTGFYELSYDELAQAGVIGPFDGADTSNFRLYSFSDEVPIEISSSTGYFASGDSIRFYAYAHRTLEDTDSEVVLSQISLGNSSGSSLRVQPFNADPTGYTDTNETCTFAQARFEQNNFSVFDYPLGEQQEHNFSNRIYIQQGTSQPYPASSATTLSIDLPEYHSDSIPTLHLHLRGRTATTGNTPLKLEVYLNGYGALAATATWTTRQPTQLDIALPQNYLYAGTNTVTIQTVPDTLITSDDWEILDIDRLTLDYCAHRIANQDRLEVFNHAVSAISAGGFTSNQIDVYDVSDLTQVQKLSNTSITTSDGGVTYDVVFAAQGSRYLAYTAASYLRVSSVLLGYGYSEALKNPTRAGDLLVIGNDDLLEAALPLMEARIAEGLTVVAAPIEQVYSEFSNGIRSSEAIQNLIAYAVSSWSVKPKYVLLLGDSSDDPKDQLANGSNKNDLPIPLSSGAYSDYGNDNYFARANLDSISPRVSIGRLPSSDPLVISHMVQKILNYQSGSASPDSSAKKIVFISDKDTLGEKFSQNTDALANTAKSAKSDFVIEKIDRELLTDSATQSAVLSAFNEGPLLINYLGHGSEEMWADYAVFSTTEIDALNNAQLPIVLALNCLNGFFYSSDRTIRSLGETLLSNPNGGAVASLVSTTFTPPPAQIALANAFYNELSGELKQPVHTARLGDVVLRAKVALGENPSLSDTLQSFTLMGDPSMKFPDASFSVSAGLTNSQEDSGGGFLGCGQIKRIGRFGGGGFGNGASAAGCLELLFLLTFIRFALALLKRRPKPAWTLTRIYSLIYKKP